MHRLLALFFGRRLAHRQTGPGRSPVVLALVLGLAACGQSADDIVDATGPDDLERIANADNEPGQWFTVGRDFGETRHSPLTRINRETVGNLGFAWDYQTGTRRGLEATPVVVDGVMYTSGTWGRVYALDAKTGAELWTFDPGVDGQYGRDACCDVVNRGVAVYRGRVYVAALDGRLIALDAATGKPEWQVDTIIDHARRYTITGAPRIAKDVVVIGNSGAEFDARGYVTAYDVATGALKWRFYIVPGPPDQPREHPEMEMAALTWDPDSAWEVGGGGTAWDGMVYDPELNLIYIGTGNAAPYALPVRSPSGGDNLFLSSILAINPDTGRLQWHYQVTPGDSWDFTATQNMILAEIEIDGRMRKVIMQAPKNGFFYVIDRATGELLSAEPFARVTWASHVDMETGKPVMTENADYYTVPKVQSPTDAGAHGWQPMAYSPDTGLVYIPAWELAWLRVNLYPDPADYVKEDATINMGVLNFPANEAMVDAFAFMLPYDPDTLKEIIRAADPPPDREFLRAWDPVSSRVVWQVENNGFADGGGILTTAGGLVFQGRSTGELMIYADDTGELLHRIDMGTGIMAAPTTYEVDGEQYVAVMAGLGGAGFWDFPDYTAAYKRGNAGRIVAFKLGGGETPKPPLLEISPIPEPPVNEASAEVIGEGAALYGKYCIWCHANTDHSLLPDLRRLTAEKYDILADILLGGLLRANGMPQFDDVLDEGGVDAIRAYLLVMAREAYDAEQAQASAGDD